MPGFRCTVLEGFHRIWSPPFVHMHDLRMTFRTTALDDSGNNAPGSLLQQTETEASSLFNLMRLLSRCMQSTMPSAPTFKRINISPVTVLAVQNNCIWYSVRVVPLSAGRTTLVYDVYCKAGRISSEEIVALRERSRNAIQGFEARWKSGDKSGYVLHFLFFFFLYLFFPVFVICLFGSVFSDCSFQGFAARCFMSGRTSRYSSHLVDKVAGERRKKEIAVDGILAVPTLQAQHYSAYRTVFDHPWDFPLHPFICIMTSANMGTSGSSTQ